MSDKKKVYGVSHRDTVTYLAGLTFLKNEKIRVIADFLFSRFFKCPLFNCKLTALNV